MGAPLNERVLDALLTSYMPFGHLATQKFPDEEKDAVKAALDALVADGKVELSYGRGYRRIPTQTTVPWSAIKLVDIDFGVATNTSESRYRFQIGDWDAWWVKYGDDHGSGAEWQADDTRGTIVPDPDHIVITHIPADVPERCYDLAEGQTEAPIQDLLDVLCEDADDAYWPQWRQYVEPAEKALKERILPWSPGTEES